MKLALVLSLSLAGCAQIPAITADVVSEVQCVEAQLAKGTDAYEDIAAVCVPLAVTDVVTVVTALETTGSTPETRAAAKLVRHKVAKP